MMMMLMVWTVFVSLILALVLSSHSEEVRFATSSETCALNRHKNWARWIAIINILRCEWKSHWGVSSEDHNTWSSKPSLAEVSVNSSWWTWTPWSRVYFLGYGMCRPCDISCWSRNVPWGAASWKTPGCDRQQIPPWQPSGGIVCKVCLLHFKLCKQSHLMVPSFQSDGAGRQTCWRWPPHLWRQPCWGKTCMIFFGEHFYMG